MVFTFVKYSVYVIFSLILLKIKPNLHTRKRGVGEEKGERKGERRQRSRPADLPKDLLQTRGGQPAHPDSLEVGGLGATGRDGEERVGSRSPNQGHSGSWG